MSRTGLDHATLANALRRMAGDGSVEWVHEPMQTSVLLDIADALDEGKKLREESAVLHINYAYLEAVDALVDQLDAENAKLCMRVTSLESALEGMHLIREMDLAENAKLRELVAENNEELAKMRRVIDYLYSFAKACGVDAEDMRELGVVGE